jgi:putative oxidoreductase
VAELLRTPPWQRRDDREALRRDLGLLALRVATGGLLVGHGAQKLFGAFGGPGVEGTAGWLESMGLRPGRGWAALAGLGEFGGGLLTALGLATPLGLLGVAGSMGTAIAKVHPLNKPIWVTAGGAELPLTNLAIVTALELAGPGRFSLDHALGLRISRWLVLGGLALTVATVAVAALSRPEEAQQPAGEGRDEVVALDRPVPTAVAPLEQVRVPDEVAAAVSAADQAWRAQPEGAAG